MTSQPSSADSKKDLKAEAHAPSSPAAQPDASPAESLSQDPAEVALTKGQETVTVRVRKKRKIRKKGSKKPSGRKRVALIVAGIIVAALVLSCIGVAALVNAGKINLHSQFQGANVPEEVDAEDDGSIIEHKGHHYRHNEDVVSALVIGYDDESGYTDRPEYSCADANLLITLDTQTNQCKISAIPRNSIVDLDVFKDDGSYKATHHAQLCLAYAQFPNQDKRSAENTLKSVSGLLYGMPVNYYFAFSEKGMVQATGALGGVRLKALQTIPGTPIVKGQEVLLQGENAWRYVSYRDIDVDESALDRQERQMQFAQAFLSSVRTSGAKGVMSLYDSVKENAVTNLGASEISYLASCFASGKKTSLEVSTITGKTKLETGSDGIELERYYLDDNSVLETVLDLFYTQID